MVRLIQTNKMRFYLFKFALRLMAFGAMIWFYIKDKVKFYQDTITSIKDGLNFMHVMWAVFMCLMISHIFPTKVLSMGCGKMVKANYVPVKNYSKTELMEFVHERNIAAWKSMIYWLSGNFVIGVLYFLKVIGNAEILLISGFYFISDYICILIFCPFQTFIQKNKCCVNCRIFDWGHFMMFTPLILLRTFFSWTLFFMGVVVIVRWEYMWAKYPERFWEGSNQTLRCEHCKDKTCYMKKEIAKNCRKTFKIKKSSDT